MYYCTAFCLTNPQYYGILIFDENKQGGDNMPDYKELFYQSQAELAKIAEKLKEMSDEIKHNMECAEEEILSEQEEKN